MTANEDFLFTQEAVALGLVTDAQVQEAFALQKRMSEDLKLDERVSVILVKRGYMGEDQARRVYAKIEPKKGGTGEIQGYRLLEVVGRGAMGTVYRAIHLGLKREVALKILRQDLAGDRTQVERLRAEATMLASLDHPNIVRALDAGESNGFPYVAMEFVEGETLRDRLRREGPLPEDEALRIARALADALERARRMGVVHRDVKPGNVLIAKNGTPKLMDLGLAKGPVDLGLTQHGATVGTPQYIAPEQAIDPKKADTRSDIYALGATLYAMLTGRPPFDGQTLAEILTKVLYETPPPVRVLRPEISLETGYLVERMMLRDPSLRYRTPAMVVHDIDRLTQGGSILPTGFSGNWEAYLLRKRLRQFAVVGAVVLVLGGGGWFAWSRVEASRDREQRTDSLEKEIASNLATDRTELNDPEFTVVNRLNRAQELQKRAEDLHPASERALDKRVAELSAEHVRFRRLADVKRIEVDPLEQRGDWAGADKALAKLLDDPTFVGGPARSAAQGLRERLGERSDDAMEADRRRTLGVDVTSAVTLHTLLAGWRQSVDAKFAPTKVRSEALLRATAAADSARLLAVESASALADLSTAKIAERVGAWQFAELEADFEKARRGLEDALRDRKEPILALRGPTETQLRALVFGPFDAARDAADKARQEETVRVTTAARDAHGRGQSTQALDMTASYAQALKAGRHDAEAVPVDDLHAALDLETAGLRQRSAEALQGLVRDFLAGLRRFDLAGLSDLLRTARARTDVDLTAAIDELERYPAIYEGLHTRALKTLAAHVGPERAKWLDPVQLRDGTQGRFWEVRSVSLDTKRFTVASHSGGSHVGVVQVHDVIDLADDELWRLGDVGSTTREDLLLRALRGLATWPSEDEDFYRKKAALEAIVDAFDKAGLLKSVLAAWASERLEDVTKVAAVAEDRARTALGYAKDRLAAARYPDANFLLGQLKNEYRFTNVSRQNAPWIDAQLRRIRGELKVDEIATFLVATVRRRGGDPDLPDVTIHIDFDTKEELSNFDTGVARLEKSPANPVVTPNPRLDDLRLLILPDDAGTVVKDQPLGMRCPFDAVGERSVSFAYWPMTPVFLAIDLDGAQVGILSADPQGYAFPHDVPALDKDEKTPPRLNFYGRGRGVLFHPFTPKAGDRTSFGDPASWPWDKDEVGRAVLNPRKRPEYEKRLFAFESGRDPKQPYRVKLVHNPESGRVALLIDDREVHYEMSDRWKTGAFKQSGRIQILSYTTCAIDGLELSGRISREWLDEMKTKNEKRPTSGTSAPTPPRAPK